MEELWRCCGGLPDFVPNVDMWLILFFCSFLRHLFSPADLWFSSGG